MPRHFARSKLDIVRGGDDKSLARPTSLCRRTESIVSLERGVCSCTELQAFSCYRGWKEACQPDFNNIETRALIKFFFPPARQGAEGNSNHSDRNIRGICAVLCHRHKLVILRRVRVTTFVAIRIQKCTPWFFSFSH